MEDQTEVWKEIEGYEGIYEVSNLGRIRSLPRKGRKQIKVLCPSPNTDGYLLVQLRRDGKRKSCLVHRLVLGAFDPIIDTTLEGNHKDLDVTNNKLSNLEWCTPKENSEHYWVTADTSDRNTPKGEDHHLSVLNIDTVKEIRRLWDENIIKSKSEIGRLFGVGESTVRQVINRVTWKDV